jgi:hypothetical protein
VWQRRISAREAQQTQPALLTHLVYPAACAQRVDAAKEIVQDGHHLLWRALIGHGRKPRNIWRAQAGSVSASV